MAALDVLADGTIKVRIQDRVRVIERLAKLMGGDQPSRIQQEDVTPVGHDLSALNDEELATLERLMAKAEGKD